MITIVVTCYNLGRFLRTAVDSVLVQTRGDWELVIVNDCSSDSTYETIGNILDDNPGRSIVALHSDTNEGLGKSRNEAIARSKSEYILPLDADDFLHPEYLQKTAAVLDENKADICAASRMNFGTACQLVRTDKINLALLPLVNQIGYCALYKRKVWEQAGGYPDNAGREGAEDWEFWLKCALKNYRFANVGEILWFYRDRPDSMAKRTAVDSDYIMARIVSRHPALYSPESLERAFKIIEEDEQDDS